METPTYTTPSAAALLALLQRRLLLLDGAMGTMIQSYRLDEAAVHGEQFAAHPTSLRGNSDVLCLTRPDVVEAIHAQYLAAGVDIIQTNSFTANRVSQADYGLQEQVREMNLAAVRVARGAVERCQAQDPARPLFVAGAIGPTTRTA